MSKTVTNLRQVIIGRFSNPIFLKISPIERWDDDNYAPRQLHFIQRSYSDHHEIIAPTHGYDDRDVHIDFARGVVIILLSRDYSAAQAEAQEYYCEVPLPSGVKQGEAVLTISDGFLTISLRRQINPLRQIINRARLLSKSVRLLSGTGWRLRHLEEPEYF